MLLPMTPASQYQQQISSGQMLPDPAQAVAVEALDDLFHRLIAPTPQAPGLQRLRGLLGLKTSAKPPIRGLYLWGGVGRGKTWLVDLFFNLVPDDRKLRRHFHHFMREVHEELAQLRGQANPLQKVAERLAQRTRLLCLDEFIVTDIGDAMVLAQLLKALFAQGITLVTTSNTEPDQLYRDGLQRASFLPAIALLKEHLQELRVDNQTDYRLRYLKQAQVYHCPLGPEVDQRLAQEFDQLAPEVGQIGGHLRIFGRNIPVMRLADDVVWFDFMALCGPPRSQADYLELARSFHTVFISDIPRLGPSLDDPTRRFLYLVDEFYDRGVKLVISAAEPADHLYQGERLAFDFQRAVSRLQEMQSVEYLARAHRPNL